MQIPISAIRKISPQMLFRVSIFVACFAAGSIQLLGGLSPAAPALVLCSALRDRTSGAVAAVGALLGSFAFHAAFPPALLGMSAGAVANAILPEELGHRTLVSFAVPLAGGLVVTLALSLFRLDKLVAGIFDLALSAVLAPLLSLVPSALRRVQRGERLTAEEQGALLSGVCLCFLLPGYTSYGGMVPLRAISAILTLCVANCAGGRLGAVCGLLCGGCGILAGGSLASAAALGLCGLLAGLCSGLGKGIVFAAFGLCVCSILFFTRQETLLISEIFLAGAALVLLPRRWESRLARLFTPIASGRTHTPPAGQTRHRERMEALADALNEAAKACNERERDMTVHAEPELDLSFLTAAARHMAGTIPQSELPRRSRSIERMLIAAGEAPLFVEVEEDAFGRRHIMLEVRSCGGMGVCENELRRAVSRAMGRPYTAIQTPCKQQQPARVCRLRYAPSPQICTKAAALYCACEPGSVCGDMFSYDRVGYGMMAAVLCDGMGTGAQAREESSCAGDLLMRFCRAGFDPLEAVQGVNSIMAIRGKEVFSTADLLRLDLVDRTCHIVKMAATPTFFLHGDEAAWVGGRSLPLGASEKTMPYLAQREIVPGDYIVMASDGVTDCFESSRAFANLLLLLREENDDPDALCRAILTETEHAKHPDDRTVAVIRVESVL